jgi:sugar phosphate isomerase/epimerase
MRLGIFAKTFARPAVEKVFDAVRDAGLAAVQLNLSCAGLPTLPDAIDPAVCDRVRTAATDRGIELAAISGTFNMIHPDAAERRRGLARLAVLVAAARRMGIPLVTLCTGTRDANDMWRRHPENDAPAAWSDLVASLRTALAAAEEHGVALGVEPEVSNVIDSAARCRRLLDELKSPWLKVVMDGANLFHAGELPRMAEVLDEAFRLLGGDIGLAHAKDLARDGAAGDRAAGTGVLDYGRYLDHLAAAGYRGPLILHGLAAHEVRFNAGRRRFPPPRLAPRPDAAVRPTTRRRGRSASGPHGSQGAPRQAESAWRTGRSPARRRPFSSGSRT